MLDQAGQVTVPALHIGGWFDIFAANTARSFTELRSRACTAEAREGQRLIIGPWDHLNSTGIYPDRRFGLTADAILASPRPRLDLSITSNVFLPGHRIRGASRDDRNSNTGGVIAEESANQVTVAVNRILHGPAYPSRLILPVIRR